MSAIDPKLPFKKRMQKIELGQSVAILANLGVIAGIIFLAFELRQNTVAVQGATYQAMSDSSVSQWNGVAHDPQLAELLARAYRPDIDADSFTNSENLQLSSYYFALLQRLENSYLQYQAGVVDERVFDSYGWNDVLLTRKHFRDFWDFIGQNRTSRDFNRFLEGRVDLWEPDPVE